MIKPVPVKINGVIYESITHAAKVLNLRPTSVCNASRKLRKSGFSSIEVNITQTKTYRFEKIKEKKNAKG